ncbi:MAG: EF-P lysine aminoacylase EpmA [Fuerstiella sp.]
MTLPTDDSERNTSPDWQPTWHPSAMHIRSIALKTIRNFFYERDYCEVTTPVMSHDIVVDAHLHPFTVIDPASSDTLYLQTSPEAAMKRLLASGSGSIFQIGPTFRSAERGIRHNPEFTMVEWYGIDSTDDHQMQLTEQLVSAVHEAVIKFIKNQTTPQPWTPLSQLTVPFHRTSYEAAFQPFCQASIHDLHTHEIHSLCEQHCKLKLPNDTARDDLLNLILAECIEPNLGRSNLKTTTPQFLHSYPISQAALAVASEHDDRTARRFELYINGLELCNGYFELTDSNELARRTAVENQRRSSHKSQKLPGAPRLVAAMQCGLPKCSGVALGFERLLMALLNTSSIDHVLPFPIEIA